MTDNSHRYVVISPVKDEAESIEATLQSVIAQTVKPSLWVIVDDASSDCTAQIVQKYAAKCEWINFLRLNRDGSRTPGSAVIHAFNAGYEHVRGVEFDFIAKLDGDVNLPADYFEQLLREFDKDQRLGIASGVYLERKASSWVEINMPEYHAAGASKIVRADCFAQIGGFATSKGWDTIDEIRAQIHGWTTAHFEEIKFRHLKPEGTGIGPLRTNLMHGEIYYLTGGGLFFLLLKVLHRVWTGRPFVIAGLAILLGFAKSCILRQSLLVSDIEARHYKAILNNRIICALRGTCVRTQPTILRSGL